jgi:signal transduction histidine kinase
MLATTKGESRGAPGTLVRFGLLAIVPVIALGGVLAAELNADVQQRYLVTARTSATLITQVGIQPLLNEQQLSDGLTPDEVDQVDAKLQGAAVSEDVTRIKVWNRAGKVVYSDNHELIGRTFAIDDDLGEALEGHASASVTTGKDEENEGDDLPGPLIQVYVPLIFQGSSTPSGAFEVYLPYAPVQAAINNETRQLYVVLAAGLTLFYAAMFPIVYIADRWRRRAESTAAANLAVLERLNRLKSEFLVRMSHQFRTSMTGIEGFSELIRDSEHVDHEELKAFAGDIYDDARRLDRAFNEMIELDQMETGRSVVSMQPVDLNHLCENVILAQERHIDWAPDRSLPKVSCDESKITQVLNNLLGNAARYSKGDIAVSTRLQGALVEVEVADRGPGMPANFDATLFVSSSNGGGLTGLGLPISRQIVEMHGGRLWFEARPGGGTTFRFTLPVRARRSVELKAVARA